MTADAATTKTIAESFRDWENETFGYGYGTGEPHTVGALKAFMAAIPERPYDHTVLEAAVGDTVAWLLINRLCAVHIIEYGTSPRRGWLTPQGEALKAYLDARRLDELLDDLDGGDDYIGCYRDACNCGPGGYEADRVCVNPFWEARR